MDLVERELTVSYCLVQFLKMIRKIFVNQIFLTESSHTMICIMSGVLYRNRKQIHSSSVYLKSKSKNVKITKFPSASDLDLSSELQEKIGITAFSSEAAESIEKMHHILSQRIVTKLTGSHLDSVQIESKTGFIPLKLISQLSFPKPNLIRLDLSQSKEHLQNSVKALKQYFPFAGIQTQGYDTIEIATFKLNKVIKQQMSRDAKSCCQDTKSILSHMATPIFKKLKSQKSITQDSKYKAENYLQSITRYYNEEIDEIIEKKLEEINDL